MTLEKIIEEMRKRYAVLEEREDRLRTKARAFRRQKPFADMSDKEIDENREAYNALYKLEQPFYDKISKIQREKEILRDLLYEYDRENG